jgi:hypothetical protein
VVYRQTRFYHETDRGWLRTQPSPALWGESRTLQTDHLLWQYRRQDEAAVVAIAERMDALYTQLQRDYGLAQSFEHERQVIDVRVERVPGKTSTVLSPSKAITVPSPAVYLAPTELTAADILAQSVALAIAKSTWSQAVLQQDMRSRKDAQSTNELLGSLISGMALWQLWNSGLALSEWQNDVVQWVFADVPRLSAEASTGLPARYHELCAAHKIFMVSPVTIGIPLYCDGRDRNLVMTSLLSAHAEKLTSFGEPKTGRYDSYHDIGAVRLAHTLTMFTVIDYAVTQYGRERLPDLVAALGRYDSWETLVPSVYGVSLDEFEEGWRQHVARLVQ